MRRCLLLLSVLAGFFVISPVAHGQATDPYIGQVVIVSFGFAPKGYAECNGQLLPINQYQALFALLGTTFGGDGRTNFALPDLQGRVPIHMGAGPGLQDYILGQTGGEETVTLNINQIPRHTHPVMGQSSFGTIANPVGNVWAMQSRLDVYSSVVPDTPMNFGAITPTGGSQPHDNHSPYVVVNYVIALQGIFPSRN
jgi:microcystin-dependent protein